MSVRHVLLGGVNFFLQNDQKEGMSAFVEKREAKFTNS